MAFIPAANTVQAELVYEQDDQVVQNVLHYRPLVALNDDLMVELADALILRWETYLQQYIAANATLTTIRVTDMTTQFGNGFDITGTLPQAGSAVSSPLPNHVAVAVAKHTLFRGRSRRGRIFHPALTQNAVTDNTLVETVRQGLATGYTAMTNIVTASTTFEMVVLSRWENNIERTQALLTPVEFCSVNTTVDSQRRRLPGRGQ